MKRIQYPKLVLGLILAHPAMLLLAQQQSQPWDYQQQQQQEAPPPTGQFNPEQLATLVAPVALYPDALLSQVLVAATYPQELQQAAQWLEGNGNLRGTDLVAAAGQLPWDASIQALVVFPEVMTRLASNIQWTTDLGNAFISQQADVMNAVQVLRSQARASGRLTSTPQQTVVYQDQGQQSAIEIQPTDPDVVYVPNYNPEYIWGAPAYGYYYPPLYYPRSGFAFSFGYGIPIGGYFGHLGWSNWGWRPNWYGRTVIQNNYFVTRYRFNSYGGGRNYGSGSGTWAHNPEHRLGVPYGNRGAATRFGGSYSASAGVYGGGRYQSSAPRYNGGTYGSTRATPAYRAAPNAGSGYQPSPNSYRGNSRGSDQPSPYSSGSRNGVRSTPGYQPNSGGSGYQPSPNSYRGNSRGSDEPSPYSSGSRNGGGSTPSYQPNSGGSGNQPSPFYGGRDGGGRSTPSYQRSAQPSSTYQPNSGGYRSSTGGAPAQQSSVDRGNSGGGRATPSYRQSNPSPSPSPGTGTGYQASPGNNNHNESTRQQNHISGGGNERRHR